MKKRLLLIGGLIGMVIVGISLSLSSHLPTTSITQKGSITSEGTDGGSKESLHPLSIEYMRQQEYPGSDIVIEQILPSGSNYDRYLTSYKSDGLKIYALLTIPQGEKPKNGWPVIIFNHGYIPPAEYRTTERYIAYTDAFSRNGYVVFRSDYRGHGDSEGNPEGAYYSPAYTIDVLNAVSSVKKLEKSSPDLTLNALPFPLIDSKRMGMWGHSMGGSITLRTMVTTKDVKAADIWAGVVGSYDDMINNWRRPGAPQWQPSQREQAFRRPSRQEIIDKYGDTKKNPEFWNAISPITFVKDISGPIQIQHGTADYEVPVLFSERLDEALKKAGKPVTLYTYEGDDHNIANNVNTALQRSVDFFDKHLK